MLFVTCIKTKMNIRYNIRTSDTSLTANDLDVKRDDFVVIRELCSDFSLTSKYLEGWHFEYIAMGARTISFYEGLV